MKSKRLVWFLVLLLILSLALVACGDDDDDDGGDDNDSNDSSSQTVELSETYESTDAGLSISVKHPSGWVTKTEGGVILGSSESAITAMEARPGTEDSQFDGDEAALSISPLPADGFGVAMDAKGILELAVPDLTSEDGVTAGEPEDVTLGDKTGARVTLQTPNGDGAFYVFVNDDFILMIATAAADFNSFESTAEAMIESISVSAAGS